MIRSLAGEQHGVVARWQLVARGVAGHLITQRVKAGRLQVLHRGVYSVGPLRDPLEADTAAVLACGSTAVLSHRSAATLWEILRPEPGGGLLHVSIRRGHPAPAPSIRLHRIPGLLTDETTSFEGIPVTTPARTLLDLAASAILRELEQALARALREGRVQPHELATLLSRYRHRAGTRALRALLDRDIEPALTRSKAEALFLELIRRARLPAPEINVRVRGFEVDFLWRQARLIVEVDGYAFHSSQPMFERDRERDRVLMAGGFRVLRVTWRQLTRGPEALLAQLVHVLVVGGRS